ncbi:MAG: hypothetical protein JWO97_1171 [Acidobacteria bacterium]|nr:hypothetical protein [Acidobacteriota bacterium]
MIRFPPTAIGSDATSIAVTVIALRHAVEQHHSRRSLLTAMAEPTGVTTARAAVSA